MWQLKWGTRSSVLLAILIALPSSTALQHGATHEQQEEWFQELKDYHKTKNVTRETTNNGEKTKRTDRSLRFGGFRDAWLKNFDGFPDESDQGSFSSSAKYVSNSSIFNVTINTFSKDFLKPYTSVEELEDDLWAIMLMFADSVIAGDYDWYELLEFPAEGGGEETSAEGQTDFETNNQEEGVDEADTVKSDGTYVYAIYGDTIVVWEALTGTLVTNETLPPVVRQFGDPPRYFYAKPFIQSLLLSGSRLTAIVHGYGDSIVDTLDFQPVLYNTMATRIFVFSTESLASTGQLTKVHERDVNGWYSDARSIGDVVHLVSVAQFDFYTIIRELAQWNPRFRGLEHAVYVEEAKLLAVREVLPSFVSGVISTITNTDGTLPTIARTGLWQEVLSNHTNAVRTMYADGPVVNTYTQIASFNVSEDGEELGVSLSAAFTPSSWTYTYATPDMLIFAAQGWNWMEAKNGTGEATFLMGFSLNGTQATPSAIGTVPGLILNQYSLDIRQGHLRVATSIRSFWTVEQRGDELVFPIWQPIAENQVVILKIPALSDDGEAGFFEETGRIPDLGKEFEMFTAMRFFDTVAYAVTFLVTDPFYALNLTDPSNPVELGELSITGFSSYLHSVNRDDTMLVAVGQEANETGTVTGLQVTLFDARDPTNPRDLQRYHIENAPFTRSSSLVEWDYKAFRWLSLGDAVGLVILPLTVRNSHNRSHNYDGFLVLDVSRTGISQRFNITHAQGEAFFGCYSRANLKQRSLVFNGTVTTLKGHSVLSTDLDTGELTWELEMMKPANQLDCRYW